LRDCRLHGRHVRGSRIQEPRSRTAEQAMKLLATALIVLSSAVVAIAQAPAAPQGGGGRGRGQAGPPPTAQASAPFDPVGYWVSVVTEDWRWRMVTPPKGDYAGVPINAAAKKIADAWDPMKDEATGEACRSYGAAGLMRVPTRLHITWQDANTLKVETDAGQQT